MPKRAHNTHPLYARTSEGMCHTPKILLRTRVITACGLEDVWRKPKGRKYKMLQAEKRTPMSLTDGGHQFCQRCLSKDVEGAVVKV